MGANKTGPWSFELNCSQVCQFLGVAVEYPVLVFQNLRGPFNLGQSQRSLHAAHFELVADFEMPVVPIELAQKPVSGYLSAVVAKRQGVLVKRIVVSNQ